MIMIMISSSNHLFQAALSTWYMQEDMEENNSLRDN